MMQELIGCTALMALQVFMIFCTVIKVAEWLG
jgi:hypothetical protein